MRLTDFIARLKRFGPRMFRTVHFKWSFATTVFGVVFFTLIAAAVFFGFRAYYFHDGFKTLEGLSRLLVSDTSEEFQRIRIGTTHFLESDTVLQAVLNKANEAHAAIPEETLQERAAALDASWGTLSWEGVRSGVIDSVACDRLDTFRRLTGFPFAEIFVTDRWGWLVGSTGKTSDFYQADEEWWQRAFNGGLGGMYRSEVEFDESSGFHSFVLASPVFDGQQRVIGVCKGVVEKDRAFKQIFHAFIGEGSGAGIFEASGQRLYSVEFGNPVGASFDLALRELIVRERVKGRGVLKVPGDGGRSYLVVFAKTDAGLLSRTQDVYVYCFKDTGVIYAFLRKAVFWLGVLWVFMIVVFGAVNAALAQRLLGPISEFREVLTFLTRGHFDRTLDIRSGDEFEELARDFNMMVEELRKNTVSKDHFDQILQSMSDILLVVDVRGNIEIVNRAACEALGYTPEDLRGRPAADIFSKKDRYIVSWGLKGVIEQGVLRDNKATLLKKNGGSLEVYLGTRDLRDTSNNLIGLVCLAKDLTEINRLVEALRRSNEETLKRKDELERSLKELTDSRDVMLSVLEDTTESKVALEGTLHKLRETQDQLFQAEKMVSLGQIAAGVAHEINNPLFVISGETEMLGGQEGLNADSKDSVRIIQEQLARINDIIKRMLEFSRKRETKFATVDLGALLDKTIELLHYQIKTMGNVEVRREFSDSPLLVDGDSNQLTEVFLNLMINAAQAMEGAGGVLTVRLFSEIIKSGQLRIGSPLRANMRVANVAIQDTGVGIGETTIRKVFDPFFTTKKHGTGLGLSVCYGIIENHHGDISVESEEGHGAVFHVRLPLVANKTS